jgi:hypothetical protein
MPKHYRDAETGQFTTAEDAAARPGETVAETASYRKKPVTIEARQFDGTNAAEIAAWCGGKVESATCHGDGPPYLVVIDTLEGRMVAGRDDYVIRGVKGEFYPCKPDIFAATYEPAESVPARHATPDVAELRRLIEGRVCEARFSDGAFHGAACGLEECECPEHEWEAEHPIPAGTYLTLRLTEDVGVTLGASWALIGPDVALDLANALDALRAELAHMTEARDNARAEVERLAAKVERVRALADLIDRHTEFERDPVDFRDASHGGSWDDVADRIRRALDEEPQP